MAVLRETSEEVIPLHKLGTILREDFADEDLPWLYGVVESLEKDGLVNISFTEDWPRAVAEKRTTFGNERPEGPPCATTRVSLKMPTHASA